jgi:hypothetical protein
LTVWFDLITRELLMLALIAAMGAAPAALAARRHDAWSSAALAPILGMCVGTCVFTTLIWFWPASDTSWVVVVVALASMAAAVSARPGRHRGRHLRSARPPAADGPSARVFRSERWLVAVGQLVLVAGAVSAPFLVTLGQRSSVGPATNQVADTVGYVAEADGAAHESLATASTILQSGHGDRAQVGNFTNISYEAYASGFQELDVEPLSADVNSLLGLGATDTQSPFLIAFLVAGALGMWSAIRMTARRPSWAAVFGGALFGGAFFLQLYFDGSEAGLCGLGILVPLVVVGWDSIRRPDPATVVLTALVGSGLVACYPLFVPEVALVGVATLAVLAVRRRRAGRPVPLRTPLLALVSFALLVVAFDAVAFSRAARYWFALVKGAYSSDPTLPRYALGAAVVPGWIAQTRSFYSLSFSQHSAASNVVLAVALPALGALVALFGLSRYRVGFVVLAMLVVGAGVGVYERVQNGCSYCEDRTLLPLASTSIFLVCLGMAAIATLVYRGRAPGSRAGPAPPRRAPVLAGSGGVALRLGLDAALLVSLVAVGATAADFRSTVAGSAFVLGARERSVLAEGLPHGATVDLEGFNEGALAPGELLLTYDMAEEVSGGHVSLAGDNNDNNAMAYVGTRPIPGPQFVPDYGYVFTRVFGIHTDRQLVASGGGVALERRTSALDVSLDYGAVVPAQPDLNPNGWAWVNTGGVPLDFIVAGGAPPTPAFVDVRLEYRGHARSATSPTLRSEKTGPGYLEVCLATTGAAPVRTAQVTVAPAQGVRVYSMSASSGRCAAPPM